MPTFLGAILAVLILSIVGTDRIQAADEPVTVAARDESDKDKDQNHRRHHRHHHRCHHRHHKHAPGDPEKSKDANT